MSGGVKGTRPHMVILDEVADFAKETDEDRKQRIYRETHDARGNYFNNPNRAQRRHIAATWKNKGKR